MADIIEFKNRLNALEIAQATSNEALDYLAKGYVSHEDAQQYMANAKDPDEGIRRIRNQGAIFAQGVAMRKEQADTLDKTLGSAPGSFFNWMDETSRSYLTGLSSFVSGAAGFIADRVANPFPVEDPNQTKPSNYVHKINNYVEEKYFGIPSDPWMRAGYEAASPQSARIVGDLAAFMTTAALVPESVVAKLPRFMQIASASKFTGVLAGAGGLLAAATAPEDSTALDTVERVAIGVGAGALTATTLLGRGIGNPSRAARLAEMVGAFGDSQLGALTKLAPRVTLGKLIHSGVSGAMYSVGKNLDAGMPTDQAIVKGLEEAAAWMGYDVAFAGLGKASRLVPIQARFKEAMADKLMAMKVPSGFASPIADVAQFAANAAPGALAGMGLGPIGAAIGGAITGTMGAKLQAQLGLAAARLHSAGMLSAETTNKMLTGAWTKLSADEAKSVTRALLVDSVHGSVIGEEKVFRKLVYEALGHDALAMPEVNQVRAELGAITSQIAELTAKGVPETDASIVQLATRAFEKQERLGQLYDEVAATFTARPRETYGKATAAKEVSDVFSVFTPHEVQVNESTLLIKHKGVQPIKPTTTLATTTKRGETALVPYVAPETAVVKVERAQNILEHLGSEVSDAATLNVKNVEAVKGLDAASRVVRPVETSGRRVAPAGAGAIKRVLTDSVSSQGASSIPDSLLSAQQWAGRNGMTLRLAHDATLGKTTYILEHPELGEVVRSRSLGGLKQEINAIIKPGEAGFIEGGFGRTVGGAAIGALATPLVTNALGMTDSEDPLIVTMGVGALIGAGVGFASLKRAGLALTPEAEKVIKFTNPTVEGALSSAEAAKFVGKTPEAFTTKVNGKTVSGRRLYWLLPHEAQVDHTIKTLEGLPKLTRNAKGKVTEEARRAQFESALTKFTPFHLTDAEYDKLHDVFFATAEALGYSKTKAEGLFTGMMGWMTTPIAERGSSANKQVDMLALARDPKNPFNTAKGIEEIRSKVLAGEVLAGPPQPLPETYRAAARKVIDQANPPANAAVAALKEAIDSITPVAVEGQSDRIIPWFGEFGLRPNVSFLRYGERILAGGDPVGQLILDVTNGAFKVASEIQKRDDIDRKTINDIFQGITTKEEHNLLRDAVEDPLLLDSLRGKNTIVYEAALATRKFLDDRAVELGLETGQKIEHYFPWVYNHNTLKEMREAAAAGKVPLLQYDPTTHMPRHVFFQHFEQRVNAVPMGERVSPMTSLLLYAHGSNRKLMMDQLLTNVTPELMGRIAKSQPWIAKDMGAWLMDMVGVPSAGTIRLQQKINQIGLKLEKFPMFAEGAFGKDILDRYFLSPSSANNIARAATFWAYTSKISFNLMSSMVNASQMIVNGGTDLGLLTIFSSMPAAAALTIGETPGLRVLAPVIDPAVKNIGQYRRILEGHGLFGRSDQAMFDAIARHEAIYGEGTAHAAFTGAVTGATVGAVGTAAYNRATDSDASLAEGAVIGGLGSGIAAARSSLARRILMHARDLGSMPFQMAETMNRATVGIAGFKEAKAAARATEDAGYAARRKAREVIDQTIVGAIGGGALGYTVTRDDPGQTLNGTLVGAALGSGVAGVAQAAYGTSTFERVQRSRQAIADSKFVTKDRIFKDQAKDALRPYTQDEINELYGAMVTDITQFRMGREGRGTTMNTPLGQMLGALQSYTLNQADFVGGRGQAFWQSVTDVMAGKPGAKVDFRLMRYAAFVMGTGAVYSTMFGSTTGHDDPQYWMSRVGMGVMPWLRYDDNGKAWTMEDFGSVLSGPIVTDIWRTANSFLKLWTDDNAQKTFLDVSDKVASQLFIGAKAIEDADNTKTGKTLKALAKEGIQGERQQRGSNR